MGNSKLTTAQNRILDCIGFDSIHLSELSLLTGYDNREIKRVVQELRILGYPICSNSKGYWLTNNKNELKHTLNILTSQRDTLERTIISLTTTMEELT